ncbi:DUF3048 domain-containing protein [Glaciihabitans arcticus]|uniref:DUF3048 domain-containing protein n=1 Tax=Glaciihabitans arcticus TaxID=2668039 RepID=A0A4Q9GVJ1_9MICO|nr:DUF3048 domain-containing protein [Glaciihabitans arcticus]TBN57598.1 DUF3048 domain-containing protein [Glaciihabitans arcticus]
MTRRRSTAAIAVVVLGALILTGCTEAGPMPVPTPEFTSTYAPPEAITIAPLSGRPIAAGTAVNPSIAAKIDNHPAARPQVGLETTDIVFEELVEGGLTRYVAIWQSKIPAELGPVRSIRPMDPDIVSSFGGIIAYSGGQYRFVELMKAAPVYNAIHGQRDTADTFYRTPTKRAPHNVLVKASVVVKQHSDLKPPVQQFGYAVDTATSTAAKDGKPTARITLKFGQASTPVWAWDAKSSNWLRFQTGGAVDTATTGKQLSATNVVVLRVTVDSGLGVPKTQLIGKGEGWVSTGGATVHASWSKRSPTARIRLVDDNGAVIRLAPGNTWIEMVPSSGSVSFAPPAN